MDSRPRILNSEQEFESGPKKADRHHNNSPRSLLALCHHHSQTTVRLTCEGNLHEPNFHQKLKKLTSKLKVLVSNEKKSIKVTKVEPWNSVRVTLNLPNGAAQRLQQLAEHGDANLRQLGILSIQLEGQQVISLRISNQSSTSSGNSNLPFSNVDQVSVPNTSTSNRTSSNGPTRISHVSASGKESAILNDNNSKKYPHGQINGTIEDDSSNGSSSNSYSEQSHLLSDSRSSLPPKLPSSSLHAPGSGHEVAATSSSSSSSAQSLPPSTPSSTLSSLPPPAASNVTPSQPQKVYFSQTTTNRAGNSLLLPAQQPNQLGTVGFFSSKSKPTNSIHPPPVTSFSQVFAEERNGNVLAKRPDSTACVTSSVSVTQVVGQPTCVSNVPFTSFGTNVVTSTVSLPFASTPAAAFTTSIRKQPIMQFNGPRSHLISSTSSSTASPSQPSFIMSQNSVPQASTNTNSPKQSPLATSKSQESVPQSSSHAPSVVEPVTVKSLQPPFDHNANYVNSSSSAPSTLPLYQSLSTSGPSQQATTTLALDGKAPLPSSQTASFASSHLQQASNATSDILGSSVDAVDDEDLLASVAATGANSIDFNSFTDLNDLNLLSMLEDMESANQPSKVSSTLNSAAPGNTIGTESNQLNESSAFSATASGTPVAAMSSPKVDSFRSPNVIAPQSTQSLPFILAQQQQVPSKVGPTVASGGQPVLINTSTGAVLSQAAHLSRQIMAPTSTTSMSPSTMYPFTSMQHASIFTSRQQTPLQQPPMVSSSPRHVILPVRQIPAVRAAATQQQVAPPQLQLQTVPLVRAIQPTATTSNELLVQQPVSQQHTAVFRQVGGQLVRQQLPTSVNAAMGQQQQQIMIRQGVPFSAAQQVANCANSASGQQNAVALSSPLLVNLLQSDVQPSTSHAQSVQHQPTFMTQSGTTQQIRLIAPSGAHADGTQVMMMVRVSSAPQGTTTQLINPANVSIMATVPSSQVVTPIAAPTATDQKQQQQINVAIASQQNQSDCSSIAPIPKPKKPRKSRSKKARELENAKAECQLTAGASVPQTSIAASIPQVVSAISSGAITSIPLSLATSSPARLSSSSASTILTFPASSISQTLKLQSPASKSPQTLISGQAGQHLFNQKQRVQPVVMIATTNGSLLSSVGNVSEANVAVSNAIGSSTGTFIITNVNANCLSGGTSATSTSTTTTAGVQLSSNRKQIFLATKSNSFPVSSALSAGGLVNRLGANSTSSSPSLNASPVKFISQAATSQVPICIAVSSNSSTVSLSTIESSLATLAGKSSLGNIIPVSIQPENSASSMSSNVGPTDSTVFASSAPNSAVSLASVVTPMVATTPLESSVSLVNTPIATKATFASDTLASTCQPALITASNSISQMSPVVRSTSATLPASSLLLNKLTQSSSILTPPPSIVMPSTFVTLPNKTMTLPVQSPMPSPQPKQALPIKVENDMKDSISSLNASPRSFTGRPVGEPATVVTNLLETESKIHNLFSDVKKPPPPPKSLARCLDDVFETEGSATSKLDIFADDDPELSAPISPSYFLAPPSAFDKSSEAKESQSNDFLVKSESTNSQAETSLSNVDLSTTPSGTLQKESTSMANISSQGTASDSNLSLKTTTDASFASLGRVTSPITTTMSSVTLSTEPTKSDGLLSAKVSVTKSGTETLLSTRSNSYDSVSSYFMANKHSYSQDLPDHILEDEDGDDSDTDMDFSLGIFPKPRGFLSGSIGSIGGTSSGSLGLSSTSSESTLSTSTAVTSIVGTTLHDEPSPANNDVNSSKAEGHESITNDTPRSPKVTSTNSAPTSVTVEPKPAAIDGLSASKLSPQPSLTNGDVSPNASPTNLNPNPPSECNLTTNSGSNSSVPSPVVSPVISLVDSKIEASSNSITRFQPATVVASKNCQVISEDLTCASTENSSSDELANNILTDSVDISLLTENHEPSNLSMESNTKMIQAELLTQSKESIPAKSKDTLSHSTVDEDTEDETSYSSEKVPISTVSTNVPEPATDSTQTSILSSKSELHSLLASPMVTASIAFSSASTSESGSPMFTNDAATNCSTESPNAHSTITSLRPPSLQTKTNSSNSAQNAVSYPATSKMSQSDDNSPATSTSPAPATLVKVLVPGVNIAGSTANKLLTMAASVSVNSGNVANTTILSSSSSQNTSDQSGNKIQNQSIQPVLGTRYFVTRPTGQYQQFVVVNANSSGAGTGQQIKLVPGNSTKLAVSSATNSQSIFIPMVSSTPSSTRLSIKSSNIQTIHSNDTVVSSMSSNQEPKGKDGEPDKFSNRKMSVSSAISDTTQSDSSDNLDNTLNDSKTISSEANAERRTTYSSTSSTATVPKSENSLSSIGSESVQSIEPNSVQSPQVNAILSATRSNAIQQRTPNQRSKMSIPISDAIRDGNAIYISRNHTMKINAKPESNNLCNDANSAVTSTARTVHIMLPTSSESMVAGSTTTTSASNLVILRADTKQGDYALKNVTGPKRQIVITKPNVVNVHNSTAQPSSTAVEATQSSIVFASKPSVASITATKTLPTILRQSKRKADSLYHVVHSPSESPSAPKIPNLGLDYLTSMNSDHTEAYELDSSLAGSSVAAKANKSLQMPHGSQLPNDKNALPVIDFVDDSNSAISEPDQAMMMLKPRKRARKSKVTTMQQPTIENDLGTSLLLTEDYSQLQGVAVNNHHSQLRGDNTTSSVATTSVRVLRNTALATGRRTTTPRRRGSRGRGALSHSVSVPVVAAVTLPTSSDVLTFVSDGVLPGDNSTTKGDKTRKARETTRSNANPARQTRSNRGRRKATTPAVPHLNTNEGNITDNAVDESPFLPLNTPHSVDVLSLPLENSHLTLSSVSLMPQPTGQVHNFPATLTSPGLDNRAVSIMESSNSNSSTASSSSTNSLMVKRSRKQLPPTATKPSLRSNSASDTLASPLPGHKRRRVPKEIK